MSWISKTTIILRSLASGTKLEPELRQYEEAWWLILFMKTIVPYCRYYTSINHHANNFCVQTVEFSMIKQI